MQEPLKLNKEALSALISANVTVFGHDYGTKQVGSKLLIQLMMLMIIKIITLSLETITLLTLI